MRDVLDNDLAELYAVRESDDVRLARLRERLFAEKPVPRSRRWTGIAAVAVAVVMITGLVVLFRPASHDAAVGPLADAAALLERAEQPTGPYRHITYTVWQVLTAENEFSASAFEFQYDVWLPTAPDRKVVVSRRFAGGQRPIAGELRMPPEVIPENYTGPALWSTVCPQTPCEEVTPGSLGHDPTEMLENASASLLSPFTTNEQKADLYRELADSSEIRWDNGKVSAPHGTTRFTIDPATGEVTGMEQHRSTDARITEDVVTTSVTITYEWTDQRPS